MAVGLNLDSAAPFFKTVVYIVFLMFKLTWKAVLKKGKRTFMVDIHLLLSWITFHVNWVFFLLFLFFFSLFALSVGPAFLAFYHANDIIAQHNAVNTCWPGDSTM